MVAAIAAPVDPHPLAGSPGELPDHGQRGDQLARAFEYGVCPLGAGLGLTSNRLEAGDALLQRWVTSPTIRRNIIRDRHSFMRFLGLGLEDAVPDAKTFWLYREALAKAGAVEELFDLFDGFLKDQGYLASVWDSMDSLSFAFSNMNYLQTDKTLRSNPPTWRGNYDCNRDLVLLRPTVKMLKTGIHMIELKPHEGLINFHRIGPESPCQLLKGLTLGGFPSCRNRGSMRHAADSQSRRPAGG